MTYFSDPLVRSVRLTEWKWGTMDLASSALKDETQQRVHVPLHAAHPLLAVVVTMHRLWLLAHFDRVLLAREGRIVDHGGVAAMAARHPHLAANPGKTSFA